MPADVTLFSMLRLAVLDSLTTDQLYSELGRAVKMQQRVAEYNDAILAVLQKSKGGARHAAFRPVNRR